MKYWFGIVLWLVGTAHGLWAEEKKLICGVTPEDYAPYFMMLKEGQPLGGIMVDVLNLVAPKYGYTVVMQRVPRKRLDIDMADNKLDTIPLAKEWSSNPAAYVFTEAVVDVQDVIFILQEDPAQKLEDLFGKKLGTHLGYGYPDLEPYFQDKRLLRDDTVNEEAMLQKLLLQRTAGAVVSELVGLWLSKQNQWQGKFRVLHKLNGVGYRFMFTKKRSAFVEQFNQELATLKQNGSLAQIIAKYK